MSSCATRLPPVPEFLKAPCLGPPVEGVETQGQLAAFSIRQEGALQTCDVKREALVWIAEAKRPKARWKVW